MPDFLVTDQLTGQKFKVTGPSQEEAMAHFKDQHTNGKIPQQSQMGAGEQFMAGVNRGIGGYGQLAAHLAKSPEEAAKVDLAVKMRDQQIQQRGGLGLPGFAGEMVAQAPALAAGTATGGALDAPIVGGAIGGALTGLTSPTTGEGNYWTQKQDQVLMDTAFGTGATAGLRMLGGFLGPKQLPEAQKWLVEHGVQLTPGQLIGDRGAGIARRVEEAAKSWPILGRFIAGAEGRGIDGFNRAVGNQALEPIGEKLAPGTQAGPEMIAEIQKKFDGAYDNLLPQMRMRLDHDLGQDIAQIRHDAGDLPEAMQKQFNAILERRLIPLLARGPIGGEEIKIIDRAMRDFARDYQRSGSIKADPDTRMMGDLFGRMRTAIRDALGRQNAPELGQRLQNIDKGYAMLSRIEGAATRRATSDSRFTPADLLSSIKSQDKTARHRAFATGDALMQVYAQYGQKVLPGKLPDSGTPERYLYDTMMREGTLPAILNIGTSLTAGAPYTRPGMAVTNALFRPAPEPFQTLGAITRHASPVAGPAGALKREEPKYGGPQQ